MSNKKLHFLRVRDLPNVELYQGVDTTSFVPPHVHFSCSLGVVDTGVRIHETKLEKYYMTPGSFFIVNYGEAHSSSVPKDYSCSSRCIRIDPSFLSNLVKQITGQRHDTILINQPVIQDLELSRQIRNLYIILGQSGSSLEKECFLLNLFAKLYGRHIRKGIQPLTLGNERKSLSRVCEYLQDCCSENVSLDRLSEIANLSPYHLSRVFKKTIGVSPHAYQLQVRLKKATDLLALGYSIAEVALTTGFCDQSHLHRAFLKKFGITPGQYEY
jgi:AraC-like DNA-binding protein